MVQTKKSIAPRACGRKCMGVKRPEKGVARDPPNMASRGMTAAGIIGIIWRRNCQSRNIMRRTYSNAARGGVRGTVHDGGNADQVVAGERTKTEDDAQHGGRAEGDHDGPERGG